MIQRSPASVQYAQSARAATELPIRTRKIIPRDRDEAAGASGSDQVHNRPRQPATFCEEGF